MVLSDECLDNFGDVEWLKSIEKSGHVTWACCDSKLNLISNNSPINPVAATEIFKPKHLVKSDDQEGVSTAYRQGSAVILTENPERVRGLACQVS
eukprot:m.62468 g.62468  ORF g.62468 m.62468 type:complete len:95 (+) comp9613_c0_seq1:72-356(+)